MFRIGQVTKRLIKCKGNLYLYNPVNVLYTKEVQSQNAANHLCCIKSSIKRSLVYNGSANFESRTKRFLHFKSSKRSTTFETLYLNELNLTSSYTLCRNFHLSEYCRAAPILPVIGAFLARFAGPIAQLLKLMAIVAGRTFRTWWKNLPDNKKEKLKEKLFSHKELIGGIISILTGGWLFLYYIHLEKAPYTMRSRYVGVNHKQIREIAESQWRELLERYAEKIVPVSHPDHKRVFHIASKLIMANTDEMTTQMNWEVNVISSDEINAFVLPNGQMFVFNGLLKFLNDDDSLSIILGHEIAHAILQHSAEQLCFNGFINLVKIVLLASIWALIPSDLLAFLTQFIQNTILGLLWNLPYSRTLEEEADRVGLYFAAKACFDVREGPNVWQKFAELEKLQNIASVEWLSTHPSHENRGRTLETIIPEALALRKLCKCPDLTGFPSAFRTNVKPLTLSSFAGVNNRPTV